MSTLDASPTSRRSTLELNLLLALAYVVTGGAGLLLGAPSPVFPSAGLALAAMLWVGARASIGIWLGAVILNLSLNWLGDAWLGEHLNLNLILEDLVIASGATLQAWVGARLVKRSGTTDWRALETERDALMLLGLGGVLAGVVSATFGSAVLWAAGRIDQAGLLFTWWTWYVGDVIGILIFAPLTLLLLNQDDMMSDRRRRVAGPLLLSLLMAILTFHGASRWEQAQQQQELQRTGEAISRDIGNRLASHRGVLMALRQFDQVTPALTPELFAEFAQGILRETPEFFMLGLVDLVPGTERPGFEALMRQRYPGIAIPVADRDEHNVLIPAKPRSSHAVVGFVAPERAKQRTLGLDLRFEPIRSAAVDRALASERLVISEPLLLPGDANDAAGFIELLALRSDAAPGSNPETRLVAAWVRFEGMMADLVTAGSLPPGLTLELTGSVTPGTGSAMPAPILRFGARDTANQRVKPLWTTTWMLGDRQWAMTLAATPTFLAQQRPWLAWAVGVFGLFFAALLQVHLLGMTGSDAVIRRNNAALTAAQRQLSELNSHLEAQVAARTQEAEAAIRRLDTIALELTENIPVGTYTMVLAPGDSLGRFSFMSRRFLELTGLKRETAEKDPLQAFACVHPDDYDTWLQKNAEAFGNRQPFFGQTRIIVHGQVRWITAESIPRALPDGTMIWEGVLIDVTDRVLAQHRLEESEARLRRILDNIPVPVAIYDTAEPQQILFVNKAFVQTFGYTLDDIPTLTDWAERAYPHPDERRVIMEGWNVAASQARRDRTPIESADYRIVRKDGQERDVVINAVPLDEVLVVAFLDLTERKQAELSLLEAKQHAERLERVKSEFLANMSHEIRTPLNGVLGLAQLLEREPLKDSQQVMVQRIQSAGRSLLGIINDILDFSKIESGRMTVEWHPFDLGQSLTKLDGLMSPSSEAKGLALRMPLIPDDLRVLQGDALRLEQVLMNLLSNAIKFTEKGQVTVSVAAMPVADRSRRVRFEIRDMGNGIPPERLGDLFTPFTQGEAGITRQFGGTGLGLSIAKRLVQLMGGTIGVESEVGKGSLFWFELPFGVVEPAEMLPVKALPTRERMHRRLQGLHCLVVDDSAMNRGVVEQILTMEGATVETADDGRAAVDRLRQHPDRFDAVLMDVQMPVMDGLTATRLIRNELHLPDLPVIALTAGVLPEQREAAHDAGVTDFLAKPLDLEELTVCLLKWAGRAAQPARSNPETEATGEIAAPSGPATKRRQAEPAADVRVTTAAHHSGADPSRVDAVTPDFPDIAGIDRQRAARTLGGNRAFFLRLLRDFADEYAGFAERVRAELAEAGDRETAARRLHTLRGNAGNIGAMGLMQAAGELEHAVRHGEVDIDERLESLSAQIIALNAASSPWRTLNEEAEPEAGSESASSDWDADRFAALCAALRNNQFGARRLFEELQPALRRELGDDAIAAVAEAVRALRYREALERLQALPVNGQGGHLT